MRIRSKIWADFYYFATYEISAEVIHGNRLARGVFLTLCLMLTGSFMTSDELLGTSTAHKLALLITAYTCHQGVRFFGRLFGLNFGLLWAGLIFITFRMIGFILPLTFKVLERLEQGMAGVL